MGLSVIVTSYRSAATLSACVERLQQDPDVRQILVADCSESAPALPVAVRRFPTPTPVPEMRWAMLPEVTEAVVACLEGRCIPPVGWGATIVAAHAEFRASPAIGGAVDNAPDASWIDHGVWFCEYAAYAPPLPCAPAADLSGAHLSYKTAALRQERDLLATGAWETLLHHRWRASGLELRTIPSLILFRNGMSAVNFLRQRVHYGREFAAARFENVRRWEWGLVTPLLPALLTIRTAVAARRAGRLGLFLKCLPVVFFFHSAWSAGELLGYWFGSSGKKRIY